MTKCIAFHSYKGGTGKTTIASNLAALLAKKGFRVSLLDLDVYAPSLHSYFDKQPKKWINDFLSGDSEIDDVMLDMTDIISRYNSDSAGKLWVGFANSKKEEVYKLDSGIAKQEGSKLQLLRKFIQLREELISKYDADYVIIDTSPGLRYWSINALAVADTLFLTLKVDDLDIEGTKKMADEIYSSFTKFGAKSFLILNRVAGYCVPNPRDVDSNAKDSGLYPQSDTSSALSNEVDMAVISAIPCYCDIQFSRKEFLTVLTNPNHPFARQVNSLTEALEKVEAARHV